jgi:hypothetical protein
VVHRARLDTLGPDVCYTQSIHHQRWRLSTVLVSSIDRSPPPARGWVRSEPRLLSHAALYPETRPLAGPIGSASWSRSCRPLRFRQSGERLSYPPIPRWHVLTVSTWRLLEWPSIRREATGSARDVEIPIEWLRGRGSPTRPPTWLGARKFIDAKTPSLVLAQRSPVPSFPRLDLPGAGAAGRREGRFRRHSTLVLPHDLPGKYDRVIDVDQASHL